MFATTEYYRITLILLEIPCYLSGCTKSLLKYQEQLAQKMKDIGINETKASIANRLHRGAFSFAYALCIFKALGLKKLNLEDYKI